MLMVLVAVTVAALVAYTVLSSAALSAQAQRGSQEGVQSAAAAKDAARLAMHYLMHPDNAPAADQITESGRTFWRGRNGFRIGGGDVDVSVRHLGDDLYEIMSIATRPDGAAWTVTAQVRAKTADWTPHAALQANHARRVPGDTTIDGDVWSGDSFSTAFVSGVTISGGIYTPSNPHPTATGDPAPALADLALVQAANGDFKYEYNGITCLADEVTDTELYELDPPNASNLGRVYIYNGTSRLEVHLHGSAGDANDGTDDDDDGSDGTPVRLTIVAPNADVWFHKGIHLQAIEGLPLLVAGRNLAFDKKDEEVHLEGLVYLGEDLLGDDDDADMRITGALLHAGGTFTLRGTDFKGALRIDFDADAARVQRLLATDGGYGSLVVESWQEE